MFDAKELSTTLSATYTEQPVELPHSAIVPKVQQQLPTGGTFLVVLFFLTVLIRDVRLSLEYAVYFIDMLRNEKPAFIPNTKVLDTKEEPPGEAK
ncbi:hypothetical protein [Microseira sp. BLCC-F43]|jgi:hypothetical protein|uniref:hypothetical protein n=1 Tax=Microseira sp. BLCC-F43 TaxID=3153602 RepID=UPI0035BA0AB0